MRKIFLPALAATLALAACGETPETPKAPEQPAGPVEDQDGTVLDVAQDNGDFTKLVEAVEAVGLTQTVSGVGPFTLFAPTDAAFATIPAARLDSLMLEENRASLVNLVTYHLVAGQMTFEDMEKQAADNGGAFQMNTVRGLPLIVRVEQGTLTLEDMEGNKASVTAVGVEASNGLVHVIDTVMFSKE